MHSYLSMILIMFASGLLSSMWVWSDKLVDVRISLNDVYMILLMSGLMIFFTAMFDKRYTSLVISALFIIFILYCIRTQFLVNKQQYYTGMIPHHSMAIHQSKKLLTNYSESLSSDEIDFINNIIRTQEREIEWMKSK